MTRELALFSTAAPSDVKYDDLGKLNTKQIRIALSALFSFVRNRQFHLV